MRRFLSLIALAVLALLAGCGGSEQSTTVAGPSDEELITEVMLANELGGGEQCAEIYTLDYLEENWNKNVTAYPGRTPLQKCENTPVPPTLTEDQVKIKVVSVDGDTAVATSKVGAYAPLGFTLVRSDDSWRIDGFTD